MPNPGFEKIHHSDTRLFGPRKLLLCGFPAEVQSNFKTLLEMLGLDNLPLVWVSDNQSLETLQVLVDLPDGWGASQSSTLPRTIIASGITENELHRLMSGCRKAGIKRTLWAALTPTSSHWPLQQLLAALTAEHEAVSGQRGVRQPPIEAD